MALASVVFVVCWRRVPVVRPTRSEWLAMAFMAFCEPCLYFIFEAWALQNTTASQAGMITSLLPLLVALAAGVSLKERFPARAWAGFVLAIAGAVWLSLAAEAQANAPAPMLGNFQEFLAMVCATGYTVSLKHLSARHHALFLTAVQSFAGTLFFLPVLFLPGVTLPSTLPLGPTLAVVYLGVVITMGGVRPLQLWREQDPGGPGRGLREPDPGVFPQPWAFSYSARPSRLFSTPPPPWSLPACP